jgi:hypothetical protein
VDSSRNDRDLRIEDLRIDDWLLRLVSRIAFPHFGLLFFDLDFPLSATAPDPSTDFPPFGSTSLVEEVEPDFAFFILKLLAAMSFFHVYQA